MQLRNWRCFFRDVHFLPKWYLGNLDDPNSPRTHKFLSRFHRFAKVRPGPHRAKYDEKVLGASSDWNDQAIYEEAEAMFLQDLEKYGVTPESCATKYCPRVAHLFGGSPQQNEAGSSYSLLKYSRDSLRTITWPGRMFYDQD